ncbi:MAG TPA: sigma-E factor negative regulatory protein [Burkholderiales bacterium]|jgi:sigma-E factor negative regulatory protein RseA
MKSTISALMDGELERRESAGPLDALKSNGEARDSWRAYHLIGDAMRDTRVLSGGFAARVAAKLAAEPTVMAPVRLAQRLERPRWQLLSAAASLAAVAMVTGAWYAVQEAAAPGPQVAQVEQVARAAPAPAVQVQPPDSANDYLYAHQGYSPRNSLQGMAPYVRMVSSESRVTKQ